MLLSRKALKKQGGYGRHCRVGPWVLVQTVHVTHGNPMRSWRRRPCQEECRYSKLSEIQKRTDKAVYAAICSLRVMVKQ